MPTIVLNEFAFVEVFEPALFAGSISYSTAVAVTPNDASRKDEDGERSCKRERPRFTE